MSKKLRKTLERISDKCGDWLYTKDVRSPEDVIAELHKLADKALAEPLKNCEVGTAKEQLARFTEFCLPRKCSECQLYRENEFFKCGVRWSQMPYEPVKTNKKLITNKGE